MTVIKDFVNNNKSTYDYKNENKASEDAIRELKNKKKLTLQDRDTINKIKGLGSGNFSADSIILSQKDVDSFKTDLDNLTLKKADIIDVKHIIESVGLGIVVKGCDITGKNDK